MYDIWWWWLCNHRRVLIRRIKQDLFRTEQNAIYLHLHIFSEPSFQSMTKSIYLRRLWSLCWHAIFLPPNILKKHQDYDVSHECKQKTIWAWARTSYRRNGTFSSLSRTFSYLQGFSWVTHGFHYQIGDSYFSLLPTPCGSTGSRSNIIVQKFMYLAHVKKLMVKIKIDAKDSFLLKQCALFDDVVPVFEFVQELFESLLGQNFLSFSLLKKINKISFLCHLNTRLLWFLVSCSVRSQITKTGLRCDGIVHLSTVVPCHTASRTHLGNLRRVVIVVQYLLVLASFKIFQPSLTNLLPICSIILPLWWRRPDKRSSERAGHVLVCMQSKKNIRAGLCVGIELESIVDVGIELE